MEKIRNIPATDLSVFGVENPTSEISKSIYESYKDLFINESLCSDKGESYFLADFSYDLPSA